MVKKISKSAQLNSKLNKAIIDTIVSMGGRASRKDIIAAIQNSKIFDAWESEVLPSNKSRWRIAFDIQSNKLVKLGRIIKQNGFWEIPKELEPNYRISNTFRDEAQMPNEAKLALPSYFLSPKDIDKLEGGNVHASYESLFDDLIEPPWMQIFRGKNNPQPNDLAGNKAKMLRNAFLTYERKKEIESIDIDKKFDDFRKRLSAIGNLESEIHRAKKDLSWWALIKLMLALILGLIVGMMLPMQLATRGAHDTSIINRFTPHFDSEKAADIELTRDVPNPIAKSQEIVSIAVAAGLVVTVSGGDQEIHLLIKGFKKMDPNFTAVNSILEISNQTEGAVAITLKARE